MTETADGRRVDAATEILERACDDIRDVIYGHGVWGNDHDVLAHLINVYCQRAMRIGVNPQEFLELAWPHEAPWADK
jgi:hypothetical protein